MLDTMSQWVGVQKCMQTDSPYLMLIGSPDTAYPTYVRLSRNIIGKKGIGSLKLSLRTQYLPICPVNCRISGSCLPKLIKHYEPYPYPMTPNSCSLSAKY